MRRAPWVAKAAARGGEIVVARREATTNLGFAEGRESAENREHATIYARALGGTGSTVEAK